MINTSPLSPYTHHYGHSDLAGDRPQSVQGAAALGRADGGATKKQRLAYLANQTWMRVAGGIVNTAASFGAQAVTLRHSSNLPLVGFMGGLAVAVSKAYPLRALENIGPNLKFPAASEGRLYSRQELLVKIVDGLLDAGGYMLTAVVTSKARALVETHNSNAKFADVLRGHPETLLAIAATGAAFDFAHYMGTALATALVRSAAYKRKSLNGQIKDACKHLKIFGGSEQALKSNVEFVVRLGVNALGTAWLPVASKIPGSKTLDYAAAGPLKSAAGGVLRLGQGPARDALFDSLRKRRNRNNPTPPQAPMIHPEPRERTLPFRDDIALDIDALTNQAQIEPGRPSRGRAVDEAASRGASRAASVRLSLDVEALEGIQLVQQSTQELDELDRRLSTGSAPGRLPGRVFSERYPGLGEKQNARALGAFAPRFSTSDAAERLPERVLSARYPVPAGGGKASARRQGGQAWNASARRISTGDAASGVSSGVSSARLNLDVEALEGIQLVQQSTRDLDELERRLSTSSASDRLHGRASSRVSSARPELNPDIKELVEEILAQQDAPALAALARQPVHRWHDPAPRSSATAGEPDGGEEFYDSSDEELPMIEM